MKVTFQDKEKNTQINKLESSQHQATDLTKFVIIDEKENRSGNRNIPIVDSKDI